MAVWVLTESHLYYPQQSQSVIWSLHQTCTSTPAEREGESGDNLSALASQAPCVSVPRFNVTKNMKFHTVAFPYFRFTTPCCTFDLLHFHSDQQTAVFTHAGLCVSQWSTAEGRTRGRDPGRREQKKTTWHIPHIHFTPVKCNSCEARCPPPHRASPLMQPGANTTSAAIITYSPAADAGKRVGLVRIPHPGTSFDTGHLPACLPPSFCI